MRASSRTYVGVAIITAFATLIAAACTSSTHNGTDLPSVYEFDSTMLLNQIQVLGSHNSYHPRPYPQVLGVLKRISPAIAASLDYGHRPLAQQFDLGVRQIELDVYADPRGGKFARPSLPLSLGLPAPDPSIMAKPGFKVMHEANIDTQSTCLTFVLCLKAVKGWSDTHPSHIPIMIDVEMKDPAVTPATFDALDTEIRSVFPPADLLTPDDVRGSDPSLGHAGSTRGWPTLGEARGRIMFMLDNENFARIELMGHRSLRGRILFAPSAPGADDAAVAKLNDPIADAARIKAALDADMLVRTRADADTVQARAGSTVMRQAALSSGAQFVSTDYEVPDPRIGPYVVKMPGGTPARCNPVLAPPNCTSKDVEDPVSLTFRVAR